MQGRFKKDVRSKPPLFYQPIPLIHVKTLLIKSTRYIFCVVTSHLVETLLPIVTFCLKLRIPPLQSLGEVIFELILWRDFIITIYLSKCKSTLYYQMNQILIVHTRQYQRGRTTRLYGEIPNYCLAIIFSWIKIQQVFQVIKGKRIELQRRFTNT